MKHVNKLLVFILGGFAIVSSTIYANPLSRLYISEEIFILDKSGTKILKKIGKTRELWSSKGDLGKIDNFSISEKTEAYNGIFLRQVWEPNSDGSLRVLIEQYDKYEWIPDPRSKGKNTDIKILKGINLIKKEEQILENFESLAFVSEKDKNRRVVIRLTPNIGEEKTPKDISYLPISGKHITLIDSEKHVWIDHFGVNGKFIGVKAPLHGSFIISFYPFKNAQEIGFAYDNKIEIETEKNKNLILISRSPFLPDDVRAKIYGVYKKLTVRGKYTSPSISSVNEESRIMWQLMENDGR